MRHRLVRRTVHARWVALAWMVVSAGAAAAATPSWYRVLADTDDGIELQLVSPPPETGPDGLRLRGFEAGGEPGRPQLFEQALSIAVPGPRGARLEILDLQSVELGRVVPRLQPAPIGPGARARGANTSPVLEEWHPVEAVPIAGPYPEERVVLGGSARIRERDRVTLHFFPVQYRPDGSASYVREVRLRVTFADRPQRRAPGVPAAPEPMHAGFVNATTAAGWEVVRPARAPQPGVAPQALPLGRLRIRIPARGLYELRYADLKSAGVPVDRTGFDPRTFRLYFDSWKPIVLDADSTPSSWQSDWEMSEAAIWVPGEADGSFTSDDADDRIVFYALGPEGYEDLAGTSADSLAYYRHPYDKVQYAWLVWDGAFGARMPEQPVAVPDTSTAPLVTSLWHREHFERDVAFDVVGDLWYWEQIRATRESRINFDLDLAGAASDSGQIRVALGYGAPSFHHVINLRMIGGPALGQMDFYLAGAQHLKTFAGVPLGTSNTLALARDPALDTSEYTNLLEFDVAWRRRLAAKSNGTLGWSARPGSRGEEVYELGGFGSTAPLVFDISEPLRPSRLTGLSAVGSGTTTSYRLLHGRGAGRRAHYFAVNTLVRPASADLVLRTVANLRGITSAPDMLIVTHESLRSAAQRLAAHRQAHFPGMANPDIRVVTTADIYENFSGGRLDPLAIRNFAKFLYGLESPSPLRYLLLFGDGHRDMRQIVPATPPSLVPTLQPGYLDSDYNRDNSAYAVDDWLGEFDAPQSSLPPSAPYPVADIALGRLACRSAAEAGRIVDKLIAYETTSGFGAWRARVLLAADDECHGSSCGETYHIYNTEDLADALPRELETVKFYLTEYPATLGQKPAARAAFIRAWSEGCILLNYQGHGAPRQLADEVMFLSTDVPSLTNGHRLPLFLPLSCTVSEFDDPEVQSMCEDLIASATGGAIATVGATTPTYVPTNATLNQSLFQQLFADGATSRVPLGVVLQVTKSTAPTGSGRFNEPYVLLGDPTMALVLPQQLVRFVSGADSLATGHRARVVAEIIDPADSLRATGFDGQAEVVVLGTDDTSGYRRPPPDNLYIGYDLPGPPIYRGTVPIQDGGLAFQFIVPLGAQPGSKGRIRGYGASASTDASGQRPGVTIRVAAAEDSSLGPPRIRLRFPNDRTHVKAGTLLTAEIADENGINIQGTSLRNSIYVDFDGQNEPLDVTDDFRYAAGSDSVGSVTVPLPATLAAGSHAATLLASDNLLNTASATLEFEVVEDEAVQLVNVLAFPNPFRDWTRFFFEITDPAEVEVEVFTPSGKPIWRGRQHVEAGTRGSIKWDGVDHAEDTIANGTYIYRLRAKPERPGTPPLEYVGKVVIMR